MNINKKITLVLISIICFNNIVFSASWSLGERLNEVNKKADSTNFLGIKKSHSAVILDNFKEKQQELLFENIPISNEDEGLLFDSDSKLRNLEEILKRIESRKDTIKERKKNITRKKITLKNELEDIDEWIKQTEEEISLKEKDITRKNIKIINLVTKIKNLNERVASSKKTILSYITYIYSKWDSMYSEQNDVDVVKSIILNDWDIWDLLNDIHFKTLLELSWQNLVEQYRDNIKEYYFNKEALKKDKLELLRIKKELDNKKIELDTQKSYKEELLQITRWQESIYIKLISQKQQSENKVKEKIENLNISYAEIFKNIGKKYKCDITFSSWGVIEERKNKLAESKKCEEIRSYFELESKLRGDNSNEMEWVNPIKWPSEPYKWISTFFHDEEYFASLGSEHEAVDIRYPQWTDLVAPASGYVYFVNPPVKWWYSYLALKHANWFVTVYWHLNEVLVEQFDFVEAGQVFAKSGWAKWTPGAGPMTSWPHLHFEVFKDRQNVDPLRFMDTTHLSFDAMPAKYRYKYIEDLKLRYWNRINMDKFQKFYIVWENEFDRQKYLLDQYASTDFKNWNMWVEEWINGKIDPSFLICVWLAESWLGKHLKTWYNVGNIGNTDSWWTYQFENPREWIYWMTKTLNNKYLGKYKTIDMLSRWWNKNWAIYASSSKNWHNNVVKCLSSLKGRFIEDDFKFRITDEE